MLVISTTTIKQERPVKAAIIVACVLAGSLFWLWRILHFDAEKDLPQNMEIGDPMPGIATGAFYGGYHHDYDQQVVNVVVTDTPHKDHQTALEAHKVQYPLSSWNHSTSMRDNFKDNTHKNARLQTRSNDLPEQKGFDHCTIWPINPSLSSCSPSGGIGEMLKVAGYDHTRALILYLINFLYDPEPKAIGEWPNGFEAGCLMYRGQRLCVGWPVYEEPTGDRQFLPASKHLILDYSMTCAAEGKAAMHMVFTKKQFRTICIGSTKGYCQPEFMGCHATEYAERIAKCRHDDTFKVVHHGSWEEFDIIFDDSLALRTFGDGQARNGRCTGDCAVPP